MSTFSFSYPWWYTLFCVAAGLLYAVAMYRKDTRFANYSPGFTWFLGTLRATSVFLISFLLLSPFIKMVHEETKTPIVVLATDQSSSVGQASTPEDLRIWQQRIGEAKEALATRYEVVHLRFGTDVTTEEQDSFNRKSTNISKVFQYIEDNYSDQNLGAVILATDGIYNEGTNPQYARKAFTAPVYTVALGDTTRRKDISIQNVLHNKIAYLGDQIPVQVDVSAYNCAGNTVRLTLEQLSGTTGRVVGTETINLTEKSFFTTKTFLVTTSTPGIIRFRASVSVISGEAIKNNNSRDIFIEVLDARQKILLLANAPHPDLGALKSLLASNKNYEPEIAYIRDFKGSISNYSLVVLHNLPSEGNDISGVVSQLDKQGIPRIFIVGMQTALQKFNTSQKVVSIAGNSKNNEEIQAHFNPGFSQFTTSDALKNKLASFPPLQAPFGDYRLQGAGNVYLYQNIKKIKTSYPLISFDEQNGVKTAVICGEGIWKWRLFDYLQHENYSLIDELIGKTVLLTTVKSDKRKFRANPSKNLFKDNESVRFDAQLYNDGYEMINEPDVQLTIQDEKGKEYPFTFTRTQNYYTLDAGIFPQGTYTYSANTVYNGKAQNASGRFSVEAIQLEQFDLTARHGILNGLSQATGGFMTYPAGFATLTDSLLVQNKVKPVLYETKSTRHIIELKWLFFVILSLLTAEWFLRRYFGSY